MTALTQSKALTRVARGDLCAGCGGCALVAGSVEMEERGGFFRPRQTGPLTPTEEAAIAALCPGLGQSVTAGDRHDDALWGPYLEMQVGWARDPDLRYAGASGGGLSALLTHVLSSGTVDGVVQIIADPDRPAANITRVSRSPADILEAASSRYAPSAPLAALSDLLDADERFAFVGKPCDVAALRALEAIDPRVADRIPLKLSFFCAGVPSARGSAELLSALGVRPEEVTAFRYRGQGWPGRATAVLASGESRSMSYADSWGSILSRHVQNRCKICADGTGVAADVACADAWQTDADGYPLFEEEDGVSLVVARTAAGAALVQAATQAGHLQTEPFDVGSLVAMQPGQRTRRRALLARLFGLRVLGRPVPRYRGLKLWSAARQASLKFLARNALGTLRRALKAR